MGRIKKIVLPMGNPTKLHPIQCDVISVPDTEKRPHTIWGMGHAGEQHHIAETSYLKKYAEVVIS